MDGGISNTSIATAACFGRADALVSAVVTGWFVAPSGRHLARLIAAYVDGEPAGDAECVTAAPDGAPKQTRGFSYAIPWKYQDGRTHVLSLVLVDGTAIEFHTRSGLSRSNVRFRFEEQGPALTAPDSMVGTRRRRSNTRSDTEVSKSDYAGLADRISGTTITGWAVDRRRPTVPVNLRIFVDGHASAGTTCDRPNAALRDLGLPDSAGGFAFAVPGRFLDGLTHSVSIRFEDGCPLPFRDEDGGTQDTMAFSAEPVTTIKGIVEGCHGDRIQGWAIRKHLETGNMEGRLRVQVMCDGVGVSEITADRRRADIAGDYLCDPCVGFEFKLPHHVRSGSEFIFKVLPEGKELAGCPVSVKQRSPDNVEELHALWDTTNDLCARAFKLQRQVRRMLPAAEATVLNYDEWAHRYLARLRMRMAEAAPLSQDPPLVSIVMPTYQSNLAHLTAAIESVRGQTYTTWELIVVDDGSRQHALTACLKNYAAHDERIVCLYNRDHRGISAATNTGLRRCRGVYVVLFGHDELMVEVAIDAMVREALRSGAKVVYSDEDKIDAFGTLGEPKLKPDWNYRLLLGVNYICRLMLVDLALLRQAGSLRSECDGAQDHDLMLRLSETCNPDQIVHLPEILYHARASTSLSSVSDDVREHTIEAGRRAVAEHLERRGFRECRVEPVGQNVTYSVDWGLAEQPSVTIIVPFKDQIITTRRCLQALRAYTNWSDWRVVLLDDGSVTPEAQEFCREATRESNVFVRRVDEPFNYSRLNNIAAREFPAEWYLFLNNDVFLEQPNWLRVMMGEALSDPKVAVVGVKLVYPDRTVQHGGVVLGIGGVADHAFLGIPEDHPGYLYRARCAQQYSAVTGACMLCRADVFFEVGGFDEHDLAVTFSDVDLCLKIGSRGWRVVWTPDVIAEHHESMSRGDDVSPGKAHRSFYENQVMLQRWRDVIMADPYYNPHFSRDDGIFSDLR
jgi:GT2 family glycosyltransferase